MWRGRPGAFYEHTHVTTDEFEEMHRELCAYIIQPRSSAYNQKLTHKVHAAQLCTRNRFLLVLVWLRSYPHYNVLSALFGVNTSFISREIHHIIPLICWRYQHEIQWPDSEQRHRLEGTYSDVSPKTIFAMDYTINKIGVQAKGIEHDFYRSDKHAHFFNSFGAVDFTGLLLDYEPGFAGHANDQRGFVLSNLGSGALHLDEGQTGLADGGFSPRDPRIITPYEDSPHKACTLSPLLVCAQSQLCFCPQGGIHKAHRCAVEMTWQELKAMFPAGGGQKFHHPHFFQPLVARAAALLYNRLSRQRLMNSLKIFEEETQKAYHN